MEQKTKNQMGDDLIVKRIENTKKISNLLKGGKIFEKLKELSKE